MVSLLEEEEEEEQPNGRLKEWQGTEGAHLSGPQKAHFTSEFFVVL